MNQANVITVLYNNAATVEGYLSGVAAQGDAVARVILVDNQSSDNTIALVDAALPGSGLDATLVRSTNDGFAGGYARGGREAMDLALPTLCLNPDVELASGTLERLLRVMAADDRIAVLTAPLVTETGEADSASRRLLPTFGKAAVYAALGKLTPSSLRYNRQTLPAAAPAATVGADATADSAPTVTPIEATTGALMLVNPKFRPANAGVFDQDYWMYGEDLQLCADARSEGWKVALVEGPTSVHLKGASSGRPRGKKSNIAFHRAMYLYYKKNLNVHPLGRVVVRTAIEGRLALTLVHASVHRRVNGLRGAGAQR